MKINSLFFFLFFIYKSFVSEKGIYLQTKSLISSASENFVLIQKIKNLKFLSFLYLSNNIFIDTQNKNRLLSFLIFEKKFQNLSIKNYSLFLNNYEINEDIRFLIIYLLELNFFGSDTSNLIILSLTKEFLFFKKKSEKRLLLLNNFNFIVEKFEKFKIILLFNQLKNFTKPVSIQKKSLKFILKKKKIFLKKNFHSRTEKDFLVRQFFAKLVKINTKNGLKKRSLKLLLSSLREARKQLSTRVTNKEILLKIFTKLNPLFLLRKFNLGRRKSFLIPLPLLKRKRISATARLFFQGVKRRNEISLKKKLIEEIKDFYSDTKKPFSLKLKNERINFAVENKRNLRFLNFKKKKR